MLVCFSAVLASVYISVRKSVLHRTQELVRLQKQFEENDIGSITYSVQVRASSWREKHFGELVTPPVKSIQVLGRNQDRRLLRGSRAGWFDFSLIPELQSLSVIEDRSLKIESAGALVNLTKLEFFEDDSTPNNDELVGRYLEALPIMPKLATFRSVSHPKGDDRIWSNLDVLSPKGRWIRGSELVKLVEKAPVLRNVSFRLRDITPATLDSLKSQQSWETVMIYINEPSAERYHELVQAMLSLPDLKMLHIYNYHGIRDEAGKVFTYKLAEKSPVMILRNSDVEQVFLSHVGNIEVVDCASLVQLKSIRWNLGSMGMIGKHSSIGEHVHLPSGVARSSRVVCKCCPELRVIGARVGDLHVEDCPQYHLDAMRCPLPSKRRVFFKNVGEIYWLSLNSPDELTVEGAVNIHQLNIGEATPENLPPAITVSRKLRLARCSSQALDMLKGTDSLLELDLHLNRASPAFESWTLDRISRHVRIVKFETLTLHSYEDQIVPDLFADLDKCQSLTTLKVRGGNPEHLFLPLEPSSDIHENSELSLPERWAFRFPPKLTHLKFIPYRDLDTDKKYLEFLETRYPEVCITCNSEPRSKTEKDWN